MTEKTTDNVLSVRENISDGTNKLMEDILETMTEYYSAELSKKIKKGVSH